MTVARTYLSYLEYNTVMTLHCLKCIIRHCMMSRTRNGCPHESLFMFLLFADISLFVHLQIRPNFKHEHWRVTSGLTSSVLLKTRLYWKRCLWFCRCSLKQVPLKSARPSANQRGRASADLWSRSLSASPALPINLFFSEWQIYTSAYDTVSDVVESKVHQCQQNSDA